MTASTTPDTELTWGAYLRLSRLKTKTRRRAAQRGRLRTPDESVERQLSLIRAWAEPRGITIPDELVFVDNGRGAWQKQGGPAPHRPDWDRMIKAGKAGDFGGLATWKLSRFARTPRDGEDLADLRVVLDGPSGNRFDLRDAHAEDLATFRQQIVAAAQESHQISDRVSETFEDMRAHGYRVGGRPYGFRVLADTELDPDDWPADDDGDGRFIGPAAVIDPAEAAVIRELAAGLLAGKTADAMAADLNERGVPTVRGCPWNSRNLARTLRNPAYGGYLAHRGEIIGKLANTEAILDEPTYTRVQDKLASRRRGPKPTGSYPVTGIPVCANPACPRRGPMTGHPRSNGTRAYICSRSLGGCSMSVQAEPVERMIRDAVLAAWADEGRRQAIQDADTALDDQRAALRETLRDLDLDMAEAEGKLAVIPRSQAARRAVVQRSVDSMTARYEAAESKLAELGGATARPELPELVTAEEWDDPDITPAAEKADLVRQFGFTVKVLPSMRAQGSSRLPFDERRVVITQA